MLKIKPNQIYLNDIIYDTGDVYDCNHILNEIIVKNLEINNDYICINKYYYLYKNKLGNYYNMKLFFSKTKATNVINDYIRQQQKRKERYEKEKELKKQYEKQIIDEDLKEKYIDKFIMIHICGEWKKTRCIDIFATENGIYLEPKECGHICKLSRYGKTWKNWSELEELEELKKSLEQKILALKGEENEKD